MPDHRQATSLFAPTDTFLQRHIGPDPAALDAMLAALGTESLDALIDETIPEDIRLRESLALGPPRGERELVDELRRVAARNKSFRSFIGLGYSDCNVPPVIQRNVLENPAWYTQYTPYQAEISQGRMEALLNFQTLVSDLTALPLANASLLDEATAAAEAMSMCHAILRNRRNTFFVSEHCHPQTIAVVKTRAKAIGIDVLVGDHESFAFTADFFGALLQYPISDGRLFDYSEFVARAHAEGALVVVAADLLALTLLTPPGEFGADVAIGSAQRFGVPMGYGGPHAAFLATKDEHRRLIPGRIIGVSRDCEGAPALRMALQTREQHIRRDKATSNICTAQVLLAVMAGMYAVYHGPAGLRAIAERVHALTELTASGLRELGFALADGPVFDTLRVALPEGGAEQIHQAARADSVNLRYYERGPDGSEAVGIALDERAELEDVLRLWKAFAGQRAEELSVAELEQRLQLDFPAPFARQSSYLEHAVFHDHHSEHEMLRYIRRLENRDLSLVTSMIPLGSCTMKLNGTSEMLPLSWPEFADIHPFAPLEQVEGYSELFQRLGDALAEITGFSSVSFQPNAGSQGEFSGMLVIRAFHEARGEGHRKVCLIPTSAHGTNPASAVMAGMRVLPVACDASGNVDVADLRAKASQHSADLAALMVTYPSTHGVFEAGIREICEIVHEHGGQVYMDGANMNAQVGLCRPGDFGADVCHLNLHKTFCIPHGGGGPGMGPIAVAEHLQAFLPSHPLVRTGGERGVGAISAAPWGSPSILTISWVYVALMGSTGLKLASKVAILNANYMKERLSQHYSVLYSGNHGRVGHEFIIDLRPFEKSAGVHVEDVAKRLMDYGFHAPTMSFPVPGTLMIEPTESETKEEMDRFCEALIRIRGEVAEIEEGRADKQDNVLKHAPHTQRALTVESWERPYSRRTAAFPAAWLKASKFWPPVARVDNGYGDRNLVCTCPPIEGYFEDVLEPEPGPVQPASSGERSVLRQV